MSSARTTQKVMPDLEVISKVPAVATLGVLTNQNYHCIAVNFYWRGHQLTKALEK